jgi:hypothetical protein
VTLTNSLARLRLLDYVYILMMDRMSSPQLALLGALFFVLVGCETTKNTSTSITPAAAAAVAPTATPGAGPRPSLVFINPGLKEFVYVSGTDSARKTNGLLVVASTFQNPRAQTTVLQAQTLYYDAAGHLLYFSSENEAPWTSLDLPPVGEVVYRSQSLTAAATEFTIRLREPVTAGAVPAFR